MSVLDELLEALGVSAGQGESAWRSADAEDIRDALIAYCATHRLIDVDRWAETAPMCGEWCPACEFFPACSEYGATNGCRKLGIYGTEGKPCAWERTP